LLRFDTQKQVVVDQLARPTYAKVSLDALAHNLRFVKSRLQPAVKVLAVIKADAYGHGLIQIGRRLAKEGVDALGVIGIEEVAQLRAVGINLPILLMGGLGASAYARAVELQATVAVIDPTILVGLDRVAARMGKRVAVHLKFDTGMGRLGTAPESVGDYFSVLQQTSAVDVVGVFSHLANADDDSDDFAFKQLRRFLKAATAIEEFVGHPLTKHLANSDGIFRSSQLHLNMVRPGITLFGYISDGHEKAVSASLEPVLSLVSKVVQIKVVDSGKTVGYDRSFRANRKTRVAIVPVGYADGYSRAYRGCHALVAGKRAPIIGKICMDWFMLDVTDNENVKEGSDVVCLGAGIGGVIDANELALAAKISHYEVLTSISSRLPRVYV
jgi:alanine racemase